MVQKDSRSSLQPRTGKKSNSLLFITITVLAILSIGFYYYLQKRPATSLVKSTGVADEQLLPQKDWPTQDRSMQDQQGQMVQEAAQPTQDLPTSADEDQINSQAAGAASTSTGLAAENSLLVRNDTESATPEQNQQLVDTINAFYARLDQQPYIQDLELKEPSKVYFSSLIQKLADHPPTVIRETDNLYTLLNNTAHLYRILGKKNLTVSKKILAAESGSIEQLARAFYALTAHPEYLKKEYALAIPAQVMTDYAVFFLNTMGGRLYLFRRDSTTRMVISYYAIMTLDRANIAGNSGHGVDLRPAIFALIEEMENGGKRLQFKAQYLDALYDLQEKYN